MSERQLLDALPATIYIIDLDGRLASVHHAAPRFAEEDSTAAAADAHRGNPVWDLPGQPFSQPEITHAMRMLRAGRAAVVRWEVARADGTRIRTALAQMSSLLDESHAVTGFLLAVTDISDSLRTREAALESGLQLASSLDIDRVCHDAAHAIRQALRPDVVAIAMVADDETVPRLAYESGGTDDRRTLEQQLLPGWRRALDTAAPITRDTDAGIEITTPITGHAGPVGAITTVIDAPAPETIARAQRLLATIAAQVATAVDRVRYIELEAHRHRNAAIGEVAAGVAQELRNPIFGISSAAQLLRFRAREDPVVEKNVGRVLREVERLNRMVAALVELGRPIVLKLADGDPDTVWDDVLAAERGRLESRAVAVRRELPTSPASVALDGERLAQALASVLTNAVEAAPEASDIVLQSAVLPNGSWRCRLTNRGAPIAPEMLPRVFEVFLSTKPGSTGVGLALARRIVEEHDGTIAIESTAESGTTVTITLPRPTRSASLP